MGIYPNRRTESHSRGTNGAETWVEVETEPGIERRRFVYATGWAVTRTDCYCCSCHEYGNDPACRNHGFAAQRPCEVHGMPGQPWDHNGKMPDSVQVENGRRVP